MYTGEQDRTLGNHVGWTLMKCILGNKDRTLGNRRWTLMTCRMDTHEM